MSELVRTGSITSRQNSRHLQLHQKKHIIPSGINMLAESVQICESVEYVFVKETSKFSLRWDKEDTDKSS